VVFRTKAIADVYFSSETYDDYGPDIADLHFHDIRGTTVTMLFQAGCNLGEIVAVTGHSLRRAQEILDKYLARTSTMADNAIAKFKNVLETDFAKRPAKQEIEKPAKEWRARCDIDGHCNHWEIFLHQWQR
jgi:hypothetical protein